jgi:formiminoglutamase
MSGGSSSAAAWSLRLEPVARTENPLTRPDDPRLAEIIEAWQGNPAALTPGRAVLIGFPQDEGVRRNRGRVGAADAPNAIRQSLGRLTPHDLSRGVDLTINPPLDLGNVRITGTLEESQQALGEVVGAVLQRGAVPVVLGGGHETAYGHYLGYAAAQRPAGIINVDAHLDVRPLLDGLGHSGSPFRQALEHPNRPLSGDRYVCLGAQPQSVARQHWLYASDRGCVVHWAGALRRGLGKRFRQVVRRLAGMGCQVYVTFDADAVREADVPGVSAPNPRGLRGEQVLRVARVAGRSPEVSSIDLAEINPRLDRDSQSVRWAALLIWEFLTGLAERPTRS